MARVTEEYETKHALTRRLNPKQFEKVLHEKTNFKEISVVFDCLFENIRSAVLRPEDFCFDLEFFGLFTRKKGKLVFKPYERVEPGDLFLRNQLREKNVRRQKYFRKLAKTKNREIEGLVLRLVNLPTLFEEESEILRAKQFRAKTRAPGRSLVKLRRSKTQMLEPMRVAPKRAQALLLGSRGCLRSRKLKPIKFFEGIQRKRVEVAKENALEFSRKARVRVIEDFSRTLAKPAGVLGECLSVSGRIASNYTPLSRYLHVDFEKKQILYYNLDPNEQHKENPGEDDEAEDRASKNWRKQRAFPTRKEIDEFHRLKLKNKRLIEEKMPAPVKEENDMVFLSQSERKQMESYERKTKNHREMLKKYRSLVDSSISQKVIFPISDRFLEDIFTRVEINLKRVDEQHIEAEVDSLVAEIKGDYNWSVKKAILDYILKDRQQQRRLGIELIDFGNLREWGEKDVFCSANFEEKKRIEHLTRPHNVRRSVLVKSEVKDVLKNRFSIINDGKMRKSTFSMLNRKNQRDSRELFAMHTQGSNGFGVSRKSAFNRLGSKFSDNDGGVKLTSPKHLGSRESNLKARKGGPKESKLTVVKAVTRENFRGKITKLGRKLGLFSPAMKEIKTIRAYFKYSFDIRDKIVTDPKFALDYRHIEDLLTVPKERFSQDWGDFIGANLARLEAFSSHVVPTWMQEISNVYQNSILGRLTR